MLLQDQYDVVRRHLAEDEVAARLNARARADQFALLQRATEALAVQTGQWVKRASLAASVVLAAALAFSAVGQRSKSGRGPAQDRRTLGFPLFLGISLGLAAAFLALAEWLH